MSNIQNYISILLMKCYNNFLDEKEEHYDYNGERIEQIYRRIRHIHGKIYNLLFECFKYILSLIITFLLVINFIGTPFLYIIEYCYKFIIINLNLLKYAFKKFLSKNNMVDIPKIRLKIILDLDNTLIYASQTKLNNLSLRYFRIRDYYVYKRPNLEKFLFTLSEIADLYLYTSSNEEYAKAILNIIDTNKVIKNKFYRNNCLNIDNEFIKDVNNLSNFNYDPNYLLIIDDNINCYKNFHDNIIQIKSWKGEENDDYLNEILSNLKNLCEYNYNAIDIAKEINFNFFY